MEDSWSMPEKLQPISAPPRKTTGYQAEFGTIARRVSPEVMSIGVRDRRHYDDCKP